MILITNLDSILITFALVVIIYQCTNEGMIFEYLFKYKKYWISKPLIACPFCMAFWYSIPTAIYFNQNIIITQIFSMLLAELYICLLGISSK